MDLGSNDINPFEYIILVLIILLMIHMGQMKHQWVKVGQPQCWQEKRKQKSMMWYYFDQIKETIEGRVICRVVFKHYGSCLTYVSSGRHEASSLTYYISLWKKNQHKLRGQQQIAFTRSHFVGPNASIVEGSSSFGHMEEIFAFIYDQMKMRDCMVRYVVVFYQPSSYVEDKILEWTIQNNVQPAFKRIFCLLLGQTFLKIMN